MGNPSGVRRCYHVYQACSRIMTAPVDNLQYRFLSVQIRNSMTLEALPAGSRDGKRRASTQDGVRRRSRGSDCSASRARHRQPRSPGACALLRLGEVSGVRVHRPQFAVGDIEPSAVQAEPVAVLESRDDQGRFAGSRSNSVPTRVRERSAARRPSTGRRPLWRRRRAGAVSSNCRRSRLETAVPPSDAIPPGYRRSARGRARRCA